MGELEAYESQAHERDELIQTIRKNLKDSSSHFRAWRIAAKESYDFVASKQWSDEDQQVLNEQGRPVIVFNRIARTVNAVTGLELQNRQEVNYKPVSTGATGKSDLMNAAAKWVRSNCDAEDEESELFQDVLIGGIGATETLMEYFSDPDGMVIIERCDPFEVSVDHRARKRNFDDARWVARFKSYSEEEFEDLYPDAEVTGKELNLWNDEADISNDHADDEYKYTDGGEMATNTDKIYTVIKYQYYEEECFYRVQKGNDLVTFSEGEYESIKPELKRMGLKALKQNKRKYKQAIVCRDTILEESDSPIEGFSIRFITGLRDRNRNTWFGLVELMKDPQRWANKWLSQIQFILNSNAKGGLLYEANTFTNPKKAKADWAKPNSWIEVVKGALTEGRVQPKQPPAYPDGIDRLLQQALTSINDVPGVNVEMLGIADRNQPGMIENSRKDAGVTILASFFDALRRYRKENGRVTMQFILNYISDGRLIRLDQTNAQYVPLLRDGLSEKYDILVDDAPTSPNMKEKVFGVVSSMLQIALQAGIPIPPEVLEYSPLPAALIEKWMALIEEQKNDPNAEKNAAKEEAVFASNLAKIESETVKNQTQAALNQAKTAKESDPSTYGASQLDLEIEKTKARTAAIKSTAEIQKSQLQIKNELIKTAMGMQKLTPKQPQPIGDL
jgi:hypothetical protein